jgi:hypothetical protein
MQGSKPCALPLGDTPTEMKHNFNILLSNCGLIS